MLFDNHAVLKIANRNLCKFLLYIKYLREPEVNKEIVEQQYSNLMNAKLSV